jgi:uncharacterized coiled-coil protein SlyX
VEAAHNIPWRPLGRLLVEQGLISEDELERALAEQASTGHPLGETLVELGFVSGPALSRALAAQYGLELITEAGFGTGLWLEIERRHPRGRGVELVPDPQIEQEAAGADDLHLGQLEENWARLAAAEERLADTDRELTTLSQKVQRRRNQSKRLIDRIRKRDRRIAELSDIEPDEPTHSVEAAPSQRQVEAARGHLIFAQLAGRYVLVERDDDPPEPGTMIEVGEETLLVERFGRSPLPDDPRPCVFAQQVFLRRD